jgi:hypothetical protein
VNRELIGGEMFGAFSHNKPFSWKIIAPGIIDQIFSKIGIFWGNDALI